MKTEKVITKISKWGNGYGIRIPLGMLKVHQLTHGSEVVLTQEPNGVKISPKVSSIVDLSLEEIMRGVSPEMISDDKADKLFGSPQGNEVW